MQTFSILSYPHSGNTYLRILLEVITGHASVDLHQGSQRFLKSSIGIKDGAIKESVELLEPPSIYKHHYSTDYFSEDSVLILLIRNPLEIFSRHGKDWSYRHKWGCDESGYSCSLVDNDGGRESCWWIERWRSSKSNGQEPIDPCFLKNDKAFQNFKKHRYFSNIQQFKDWCGKKKLIYYEDLLENKTKIYNEIYNLCNEPVVPIDEFLKHEKYITSFSLQGYDDQSNGKSISYTAGIDKVLANKILDVFDHHDPLGILKKYREYYI